jgi:hypothetical protein
MTWAMVGSAGVGMVSNAMGASASAGAAKADRRQKEKEYQRRKQAYDETIGRAQGLATSGEQQFLGAQGEQMADLQNPLAELGQAKQDVLTGNAAGMQQGAAQMKTNLAQSGVRGGQAATALNRGTGQMGVDATQQINQMALDEAGQRRNMRNASMGAKMGMFGQKAGAGYSGQLQQFGG